MLINVDTAVVTAVITAVITSFITGLITFGVQERKLRAELGTEFMAEKAIKSLLKIERWKKRRFTEIKKRVGGFTDDELRRLLVRAGAVKFGESGNEEFWGLISRNEDDV